MGFFAFGNKADLGLVGGLSLDLIHQNECLVCPRNRDRTLCHGKMAPYGTDRPLVYMLGEAPGEHEDRRGIPFVGPSGKLVKHYIPEELLDQLRWSNTIRCKPPWGSDGKQLPPSEIEIEACRPALIRDIEETKPEAIFGFGNVPLRWISGQSHITAWCGRRIPVRVGSHTCWYFPIVHPAAIIYEEQRARYINYRKPYKTELEFQFALNIRAAFKAVLDGLPDPKVWTREEMLDGIERVYGTGGEADLDRIEDYLKEADHEPELGFDYETNRLRPYSQGAKMLSVAFSGAGVGTLAIGLDHPGCRWKPRQIDDLFVLFKRWLQRRRTRLVSHHLAFEAEWTAYTFGESMLWKPPLWEDTVSQAFILDDRGGGEDERTGRRTHGGLSLEFLGMQHFGINVKAINNLDREQLESSPIEMVLSYNGLDAKCHHMLYGIQDEALREEGLQAVYEHQRDRALSCVAVQLKGVPVDQRINAELLERYMPKLADIEADIQDHPDAQAFRKRTGKQYRPSAPQDATRFVKEYVGEDLANADAKSLSGIKHPVIKKTLKWREQSKVASTYVISVTAGSEKWKLERSPALFPDDLLHPQLNTTRTRTNRTSSDDPNIQNWPIRKKEGLEARKQVRPGLGQKVVAFDYSGIQARNVAMESDDRALVKYYHERYDIHKDWMERIEKACDRRNIDWIPGGLKADADVLKSYRHRAKNEFVFPSFFGAQPLSISGNLGIPENIGHELHEEFWDEFPDIHLWHAEVEKSYYETGYVTGLSGFRRRAPVVHTQLINTPIQGDEARIVLDAQVRLTQLGPEVTPNLEIHDDFTFIWDERAIDRNAEIVLGEMLRITLPWVNVPLGVEMSVGEDWAIKKKAGEFFSDDWYGKKSVKPARQWSDEGSWADGTTWSALEHSH